MIIRSGTINAPISRKENSIIERCISKDGAPSITHYEVIEEIEINNIKISKVKCTLETGRTHQIRVHMSYIGHPLLGDTVYGGGHTPFEKELGTLLHGQCLYAAKLGFTHPSSGEYLSFEAPLPAEFSDILARLRRRFT